MLEVGYLVLLPCLPFLASRSIMSFLNAQHSVETPFKIEATPEYRGSDIALLGSRLCNLLSPGNNSQRLYVSATSRHPGTGHGLGAVSFWAIPDEQAWLFSD